ncbi:rhomboid family intramembrane serine protease [Natronolimnohabitans innermongolicus]|uniref:Rhomboid family protein n=1 Tax=Natronolimnohabitans innermongolicus JCM 12255 TaxID=1227499 RepID=L9XNM7_9EURY|nr:rhomboid family intramembrane serine protease [Natronolimnohabitans innermongolicus]ELY62248.1 rhomboid family protein [Natronolimnohabitans innermongolicus JCM 12255]
MLSSATLLSVLLSVVLPLSIVAAALGSLVAVRRLHRTERRWGDVARSRLVMGVPWGSLLVIALVFCVYLFVQDGITDFSDPVTLPYRAYSYFYPLGMLTASFSHAGPDHLLGNLAGAAVVAPIAEYAWSHYPDERGEGTFTSLWTNPWLRALVIFPGIVVAITIGTSFFALGPVIGFSGVVFAFAAFALVHYPIVTIVGVLGVQSVLLTVYRALQVPVGVYVAQPSPPSAPSWAGIAIQGHALGFFVGLVLGIAVLRARGQRPDALRVWLAILLYAFAQGLWQIYWFGGGNVYVLLQGPGVLIVLVLAVVITAALVASDRPLLPRRGDRSPIDRPLELARADGGRGGHGADDGELDRRDGPDGGTAIGARLERISSLATPAGPTTGIAGLGRRKTATVVVLAVFAILVGVAIPINLFVLEDPTVGDDPEAAVEIEDYTVQYAEDVENAMVSPVQIGPLTDVLGGAFESSGVIVTSEERQLWVEAVPADALAFSGETEVTVGGPGWRESVHVERTGWTPVGNDTVYQVEIWAEGEEPQLAHQSEAARADVRIDDRIVTVDVDDDGFVLEVELPNGAVETASLPTENESTSAGGLEFERDDETIHAGADGTRAAVATEETYG